MKNLFIVLEGIDGSGKTTIASRLSKELRCHHYKTPSSPFQDIRGIVDERCSWQVRFLFYLSSVVHASEEIKHLLQSNHVVCDRYLYSTLAYHYATDESLRKISIEPLNILIPDLTYFLSASYQERMKRISLREAEIKPVINYEEFNDETFQSKVEKEFLRFNNLIRLTTDSIPIPDVLQSILIEIDRSLNDQR